MIKYRLLTILFIVLSSGIAYAGWSEPVRISEPGECWYPQILAQRDTLHVVYENTYGHDKISYVRSTNYGIDWSIPLIVSSDSCETVIPQIISYNSELIIFWRINFQTGVHTRNIAYSISSDHGMHWSEPSYILHPNRDDISYFGVSSNGPIINVIFSDDDRQGLFYALSRSTDFGASWYQPTLLFRPVETGVGDIYAVNNLVYYVWGGSFIPRSPWEVYFIRSTDYGLSWSDNVMVSDSDQFDSQLPSICSNEEGDVVISWMDYKYSPYWFTGDIFLRHSPDFGYSWESVDQITFSHYAAASDIFISGDTINLTWADSRPEDGRQSVYFVGSANDGVSWSSEFRLDEDQQNSRCPKTVLSNGKVSAIWADDRCPPDTDICGGIYFRRYENETALKDNVIPKKTELLSAYPNPFNSTTIITYSNMEGGEIEIYNINGQLIRKLGTDLNMEGKIKWDARDASGKMVSSGIYFARARASHQTIVVKLLYLK